jgi:anti-anti-sigma regulatory factor
LILFEGDLDISRYPEFRSAFENAPRSVPVLVDLVAALSADSVFLSELLMAKRRHNATFAVLIAPTGHLARLFDIAGLGTKMNVYPDRAAAIASLGSG